MVRVKFQALYVTNRFSFHVLSHKASSKSGKFILPKQFQGKTCEKYIKTGELFVFISLMNRFPNMLRKIKKTNSVYIFLFS